MASINCSINNCSNNNSGVCCSPKVSISGKKSHTSTHTSCNSFIDSSNNNFSNDTSNSTACNFINCNVKTCSYQAGTVCSLNNISVTSQNQNPNSISDTYCLSFQRK